jgi:hypothetical protein
MSHVHHCAASELFPMMRGNNKILGRANKTAATFEGHREPPRENL